MKCPTHGVCQIDVPWAESGSGFTALFEALVIDWLKEASISAVSRQLGLGWSAIDGIMHRAVWRGLARRDRDVTREYLGVDEVSFRKGHDYVGVVSDQGRGHWAIRSRLEPVKKVARMIKKHLWGMINAIVLQTNNASAESLNSKIKTIKVRSRGFHNKERFKSAIYFHLGGLDLYPDGVG